MRRTIYSNDGKSVSLVYNCKQALLMIVYARVSEWNRFTLRCAARNLTEADECCRRIITGFGKQVKKLVVQYYGVMSNEVSERHGTISTFLRAVKSNSQISRLKLAGVFDRNDAEVVAKEILSNTSLRCISLTNCLLTCDLFIAFCDALERNTTLTKLNVSRNYIRARGLAALGAMLTRNKTLLNVKLHCNEFDNPEIALRLYNTICESNYTLLRISMTQVSYDYKGRALGVVGPTRFFHDTHWPDVQTLLNNICKRNSLMCWRVIHALIVDIVVAMAPLNLPGYVLLWIIDWLPMMRAHTEYKKISLITRVIASIRCIDASRSKTCALLWKKFWFFIPFLQ